jgi:molybdopterin-guanine dinucleotide biosynthesis protein A
MPEPGGRSARDQITGLILAGGRGSRLGGQDKGLLTLDGQPMTARVLEILAPQVRRVVINANRNIDAYAAFGCEVVPDMAGGYPGPLAGMAAGLAVVATPWMLSVPCDSPLLPTDLAARLYRASLAQGAEIAIPHDGDRAHPVFALLRLDLRTSLEAFMAGDERKILRWMGRHRLIEVDFSDCPAAFVNVNTADELAELAARLAGLPASG